MTDSLSVDDWARLIDMWLPTRSYMYQNFTITDFVTYITLCDIENRIRLIRNAAGIIETFILWDAIKEDPETVYMECIIGDAHAWRILAKTLSTKYKFYARHRRGKYAKLKF